MKGNHPTTHPRLTVRKKEHSELPCMMNRKRENNKKFLDYIKENEEKLMKNLQGGRRVVGGSFSAAKKYPISFSRKLTPSPLSSSVR